MYSYLQSYAFGNSNAGQNFTVFDGEGEVIASGIVAEGGAGEIELSVSETTPTRLRFVRDSDDRRLAATVFDPREVSALNATNLSPILAATAALEVTAQSIQTKTDALPTLDEMNAGLQIDISDIDLGNVIEDIAMIRARLAEQVPEPTPVRVFPASPIPGEVMVKFEGLPFGISGAGFEIVYEIVSDDNIFVDGRLLMNKTKSAQTDAQSEAVTSLLPSSKLGGAKYRFCFKGAYKNIAEATFSVPDGGGTVHQLIEAETGE